MRDWSTHRPGKNPRPHENRLKQVVAPILRARPTNAVGFSVLVLHSYNGLLWKRYGRRVRLATNHMVPMGVGYEIVPEALLSKVNPERFQAVVCFPGTEDLLPAGMTERAIIVPAAYRRGDPWELSYYDEAKGYIMALYRVALEGTRVLR